MVSVNYAAWSYLEALISECTNLSLRDHLVARRMSYERNIIAGLKHIGVAETPSTSLFQALVAGVS